MTIKPSVTLTSPVKFPPEYTETCQTTLYLHWQQRAWEMRENFGLYNLPPLSDDDLAQTMLAESLATVARAAAGDIEHSDWSAGEVAETIQSLCESWFSSPVPSYQYQVPEQFWTTDLGQMLARALLWVRSDELITLTAAAKLRGVTVQAISQAVKAERLTRYVDPNSPNPQKARVLVSREEVEGMK